jgi:hypothetical protein
MTKPFDSAWALLKASTVQTQLNTPSVDNKPENALAQRIWYKRKDANNPIRMPELSERLKNKIKNKTTTPADFEDPIADGLRAERWRRKKLDKKEQFKQQLNQYIPRLSKTPISQTEDRYNVKVGPKLAGRISVEPSLNDPLFPQFNYGSISQSELDEPARRQGLYSRALQSIIDDTGKLRSHERNINSQPFHEQFNPVNAIKRTPDVNFGMSDNIDYIAKPPKETPREFGDLQYDTGALPLYQPRIEPPKPYWQELAEIQQQQHGQKPAQQQTLDQYGVPYDRQ